MYRPSLTISMNFLCLSDLDVDQEENARLGVYWLIKASEQGHEEATRLLSHCLETGQGW